MRNKFKNTFAGLMCMCLLCGSALQASAGQYITDDMWLKAAAAECRHINKRIETWNEYTMLNEWEHKRIAHKSYVCKDCGVCVSTYEQDMGKENHSLSYRDSGHTDMAHVYEINCTDCAYSTVTSIPCNNGGPHKTPW